MVSLGVRDPNLVRIGSQAFKFFHSGLFDQLRSSAVCLKSSLRFVREAKMADPQAP